MRAIRVKTMNDNLGEVWQSGKGVAIKLVVLMRLLFQFYHEVYKERIQFGVREDYKKSLFYQYLLKYWLNCIFGPLTIWVVSVWSPN